MIVVPKQVSGRHVDPSGKYRCPLCEVQGTGDSEDPGWVSCPMVDGKMICFGSCVEYQKVARAEDFESHYDRNLILQLSSRLVRDAVELRATCVRHQIEVATDQLAEAPGNNRLRDLRNSLNVVLEELR